MTEAHDSRLRHYAKTLLTITTALVVGGALLSWSWNTFAGELFAAPAMSFRQGLAAEIFIITLGSLLRMSTRHRGRDPVQPDCGLQP